MTKYFLISNSDGDTHVTEMNKAELLENLSKEGSGWEGENALSKIPESDTNYWGEKFLIIKGEIVTPKPEKVVESYDIK